MTTKAVVLFSGGMDSTACLFQARAHFDEVHALAIDYGQRHATCELLAARRIAAKLEVPLSIYTMRIDWDVTLCALSRPLRAGLDDDGISHAFVPGRNLHFLTVAGAHAVKVGASTIVVGCCADDANAFPDCRSDFLVSAMKTVSLAYGRSFVIQSPLVFTPKAEYVRGAGAKLRALLDETWSCYTPTVESQHCGDCDACRLRSRALEAA